MREDWSFTFTSNLGPYEDNSIEVSNSLEDDEQSPFLVCILTSREGFYCRPEDLASLIDRLQKIADGCE